MTTVPLGFSSCTPSPLPASASRLCFGKLSSCSSRVCQAWVLGHGGGGGATAGIAELFPSAGGRILPDSAVGHPRASRVAGIFPAVCPDVTVRDVRLEDFWGVAETHCSSFYPKSTFPIDLISRINCCVALLAGFSVPPGCARSCLVAVTQSYANDGMYLGDEGVELGGFRGDFGLIHCSVAGILTVDTVADFLPRKGPLHQRRSGIAYISNVAVREEDRRKGIARRLVAGAEDRARGWGCRAVALHCDASNSAATRLYRGRGFRCLRVPEHARWPQPMASPDTQFIFMMKLLSPKQPT